MRFHRHLGAFLERGVVVEAIGGLAARQAGQKEKGQTSRSRSSLEARSVRRSRKSVARTDRPWAVGVAAGRGLSQIRLPPAPAAPLLTSTRRAPRPPTVALTSIRLTGRTAYAGSRWSLSPPAGFTRPGYGHWAPTR